MKKNIYIFGAAILIMVTLFSAQVFGQYKERGVRAGIAFGSGQGLTKMTDNSMVPSMRLFLRHNISGDIDGEVAGTWGGIEGQYYQSDLWRIEYKALYSPYRFYDEQLRPYLGAGLGVSYYFANAKLRNNNFEKNGYVGYVPLTLGAEYAVNDWLQFDINTNFNYAFSNSIVSTWVPNSNIGTGNDAWWGLFAGVSVTVLGNDNKAAEMEASRVRAEELAAAEAKRVQEANAAEAKRIQEANAAEARRVQEAAAAEARRVREAAEAQRIQDSVNAAKAAAERLAAVPKKEVVVPKPEPPKPAALKAEVGKAIILEGVVFQSGKAVISPESEQILSSALITLTDNPGLAVEIRGFTDNVGSAKKNLQLSQSRAEAVKAWLVKNGVSSKRITAKGYGDRNPVASNKTAEGRVKNRRIEFLRTK